MNKDELQIPVQRRVKGETMEKTGKSEIESRWNSSEDRDLSFQYRFDSLFFLKFGKERDKAKKV